MAKIRKPPTQEQINSLIALPKELTTDDGRKLKITSWAPFVSTEDPTRVIIHAYIDPPTS